VIERGNRTFYGLAAAVWTKDISKAIKLSNALRAGTVWVNCFDVFDASAPFGGFRCPASAANWGSMRLQLYTEVKTVTVKT